VGVTKPERLSVEGVGYLPATDTQRSSKNKMEQFGAKPLSDTRCRFVAWAPDLSSLSLVLHGKDREVIPMSRSACGFHIAEAEAAAGAQYLFLLPDGHELPDPASRFQPGGVHGASVVVSTGAFEWNDSAFRARSLAESVIYELHMGAFTPEGTFASAISRLHGLAELGVTALELMPVAQFPGSRNWGYDGVYPFAAQSSYGGPAGFHQFVDAAHACGMSVILDVVYNHLGPEGNYLGAFGPFFTDRYRTPWGQAINYDGADSAPVREFFIQNALYWLEELHVDGLRLDAVHGIFDFGARHFLAELRERVGELAERTGRELHIIAESDLNDARLLDSRARGGYGLDAQWSDDFHHSLHTLLTGESEGYYADFGSLEDLRAVLSDGWRYSGQYSRFRRRRHGNSPAGVRSDRFVVCSQNHDHVGNRAQGERLSQLVDYESLKLAAGVTLLSPFVPLLLMGEEYGETRPFQYFTSHTDEWLIQAVRNGRRQEFAAFGWRDDVPDPHDAETFKRSTLDPTVREAEPHRTLWLLYKSLIEIRKKFSLGGKKPNVSLDRAAEILTLAYDDGPSPLAIIFHFGKQPAHVSVPFDARSFRPMLNSSRLPFAGIQPQPPEPKDGSFLFGPRSFVVFESMRSGGAL
jgi:maltooligosyltrehalose trehalohydrolase